MFLYLLSKYVVRGSDLSETPFRAQLRHTWLKLQGEKNLPNFYFNSFAIFIFKYYT